MLSQDLTRLGQRVEEARATHDSGVDLDAAETDLILSAIYTAAEDAEALEAAQVGGQARGDSGKRIAFRTPDRREAVKRLADAARAALTARAAPAPANGGDAA